jgi:hypothetical protein
MGLLLGSAVWAQEPDQRLPPPERTASGIAPQASAQHAARTTSHDNERPAAVAAFWWAFGSFACANTALSVDHETFSREVQRSEDDLRAQQEMACWARNMFLTAIAQTLLSVLGVILIYRTLRATRDAVDEARAATKAAEDAVDVTRETAQRQLRAYVFVDNVLVTDDGENGSSHALLKLRNTSTTPAYKVRSSVQIEFNHDRRATYNPPELEGEDQKTIMMDIGGGGYRSRPYTRKARDFTDQKSIRATDCYIHVFGKVSYADCFGIKRHGRFHFVGRAEARSTGTIEMDYADQGNEYD